MYALGKLAHIEHGNMERAYIMVGATVGHPIALSGFSPGWVCLGEARNTFGLTPIKDITEIWTSEVNNFEVTFEILIQIA